MGTQLEEEMQATRNPALPKKDLDLQHLQRGEGQRPAAGSRVPAPALSSQTQQPAVEQGSQRGEERVVLRVGTGQAVPMG